MTYLIKCSTISLKIQNVTALFLNYCTKTNPFDVICTIHELLIEINTNFPGLCRKGQVA